MIKPLSYSCCATLIVFFAEKRNLRAASCCNVLVVKGGFGFEVLGFPCNDFGSQEPGTLDEIDQFCKTRYAITFSLFYKVRILGDEVHPLYRQLLSQDLSVINSSGFKSFLLRILKPLICFLKGMPVPPLNGVGWNFHKFLINRKGKPVAHFSSDVEPQNPILRTLIKQELDK